MIEMTLESEMKAVEKKEWFLCLNVSEGCLEDLRRRLRIPESMNVSYRLTRDGESKGTLSHDAYLPFRTSVSSS